MSRAFRSLTANLLHALGLELLADLLLVDADPDQVHP
jgi:hypothetical protein